MHAASQHWRALVQMYGLSHCERRQWLTEDIWGRLERSRRRVHRGVGDLGASLYMFGLLSSCMYPRLEHRRLAVTAYTTYSAYLAYLPT